MQTTQITDLLSEETLQTKLVRNGFWLYFFQFLVAPAGYLIKMMISRELSVADIGLFYNILWFIGVISIYNDLGLTEALQYYIPHYLIDKDYIKAKMIIVFTWIVQLISGFAVAGILYFGAEYFWPSYFHTADAIPLLQYFAFYFIILNLFQVISSLFIATQNVKRAQGVDMIRIWTVVILTFVSWYRWQLTALSFAWRWLCGVVVALLVSWIGLKKNFWWILRDYPLVRDKQLIWQQRKYGLRVLIGAWAGGLLWQINQQLAWYFLWNEAAWYWTYYLSFYTIVGVVVGPLISYLFPLLNELYKKGEDEKVALLYRLLFSGIIIFGVVWWIAGYFLAEPLSVLLFWQKFISSWTLFKHYAPFIFTIPLIGVLFQDIASRGMVQQRVYVLVIALIANIVASYIFITMYGLTWLVYAQLIGNLVLVVWWAYFYIKK